MRKFLFGSIAAVLSVGVASSAIAADIPRPAAKAPVLVPIPMATWSGIYIGGTVGYGWNSVDSFWPASAPPNSFTHDNDDGLGGGFVGIQQQWGQFVLGVEAHWFTSFSNGLSAGSPLLGCPNVAFACSSGVKDIWTVGPRLGYVPIQPMLLYVTGGYASGKVQSRSVDLVAGGTFDDLSGRADGWFIGGGIDYKIWSSPGWDAILGAEYQHIELDSKRLFSPADGGLLGVNTRDVGASVDVVRARLSFKGNFWQ